MRYCSHCRAKIENDIERCPICDMETAKLDDSFEISYPYVKSSFTKGLLIKLITFTAVVILGISFLVHHLVPTGNKWAFITAAAVIYAWVSAINVLRYTPNPASIVLCQLFSVSGLAFSIDWLTGYFKWSVNYVIPFLIMAAAVTTTLMIVIHPVKYRAYTVYQLIIAVMGLLAVILWIFGFSEVEWPATAAAFTSALCFFAVLFFYRRKTENELKKRFHV